VLGPLLFLCFINDLPAASNYFKSFLFADDACLISSSFSSLTLEHQVNQKLKLISKWLSNNKLCLNYNKTVYMVLSKRRSKPNLDLTIDNNKINETDNVRYLGLIFDNKLSWGPQILNISKKIASGCWAIANLRKYVDLKTLRTVYFALVYSHLHYGISCWGTAPKYLLNKLYIKQKWAIKIMTNSDIRAPSTPLFFQLHLLKLEDVSKLKIAIEIRRLMEINQLHKFNFQYGQSIHTHTTRSSTKGNFVIPKVNTDIGKSTLKFKGAIIWNNLPEEIRNISPTLIKYKYKQILINKYDS
jgi:hypothetical protein